MRQLFSKSDFVLGAGGHLLGSYRFSAAATLVHAVLQLQPPLAGAMTIGLEVNGEVVGEVFSVSANPGDQSEVLITRELGIELAADSFVRWKVVEFTSPIEDGPLKTSATLAYTSSGFVSPFLPSTRLSVQWVDGQERLTLFVYDAATATFAESEEAAGISADRAVIAEHGRDYFTVSIEGAEVLRVASGVVQVTALEALGGVATSDEPRLEFMIDGSRVATLAGNGTLRVAAFSEGTPVARADAFTFYALDTVAAVLGGDGMVALNGVWCG